MSLVHPDDSDFRVCQLDFETLLEIQAEATERGWATRWSTVDALRAQVKEEPVMLHPLLREQRQGTLRAYRCLLLFSSVAGGGAVATVDISADRLEALERIDRDSQVRAAWVRVFRLATGGIAMVSKG